MLLDKNGQSGNQKLISSVNDKHSHYENNKLRAYAEILRKKYKINNRILLIQSPQFLFESFNVGVAKNKGYYTYPPTGLQCIAKALSNRNLDIGFLDLNFELLKRINDDDSFDYHNWLDILDKHIQENNQSASPSIIGVTSLTAYGDVLRPTHPLTSLLAYLRKNNRQIIILGGPTATNELENYLKKDLCHFVVAKEGENKVNFLFDFLYNKTLTSAATNEIYFKLNGKIEQTTGGHQKIILGGNLIETYEHIPIEEYKNAGSLNPYSRMSGQDKVFGVFQLNRGCRANCRFCDVAKFMGRGVRNYAVKDVIDEINYLVKERNVRHFEVLDDDFLGNKAGVMELLRKMVPLREKYGITWSANNGLHAMSIEEDIMELIRDSGCNGFRIGIESGNAEMLKKIRKPVTLPLLRQKGQLLQKFPEIFIGANYIIGLFGEETFGQMLDTFRFSCEMNLDWSSITTFQFTSRETATVENLKSKGGFASDFIPAKDDSRGEVREVEGIISGPDVFNIKKDIIPSPEQVKQIWFAFNLVANYINNKNLKPNGEPEKFLFWIEAVQVTYPHNPYMYLFAGLANVLLGNAKLAQKRLEKAKDIISNSEYWKHRFEQFDLMSLVDNFPKDAAKVHGSLELLRKNYSKWIDN